MGTTAQLFLGSLGGGGGSSITKSQGGTGPRARGPKGSDLSKCLMPPSPWISARGGSPAFSLSGPSFLAHPWGSP